MRDRNMGVPCPGVEGLRADLARLRTAFPASNLSNLDDEGWTLRKVITKLAHGWDFTYPHGPIGVAQLLWDTIPEELLDEKCEVSYEKKMHGWRSDIVVLYDAWTISEMANAPHLELPEEAGRGSTRYFVENHTDGFTIWFEE